jgi:hypothetical protein
MRFVALEIAAGRVMEAGSSARGRNFAIAQ